MCATGYRTIKDAIGRMIFTAVFLCVVMCGCVHRGCGEKALFQASTINALMKGVYEGDVTAEQLKKKGDFGIGTFNHLDGELVLSDGVVYRALPDGSITVAPDNTEIPFASALFFSPEKKIYIKDISDYGSLTSSIDTALATPNIPYAIKVEGDFAYIKVRSVKRQERPYLPLIEVVKSQSTNEFRNMRGTLIGFKLPAYMDGLNVAGYHFHFISSDKKYGGHLMQCVLSSGTIYIEGITDYCLALPRSGDFYKVDLKPSDDKDVEKVEREK